MNAKRVLAGCFGAILLLSAGRAAAAEDNTFKVYWKDGIRGESGDGAFKWKLGGRMQYDASFYDQDGQNQKLFGEVHDGFAFRRARFELEGTIYERFIFKTQYDFADGNPAIKDMYVGMTGVPWLGRLRFGQAYEPISIDQLTSSKYSEYLERGLTTTFTGDRNPGIMANNSFLGDRITYQAGIFRNGSDISGNSDGDGTWSATGRLTGLPWYGDENQLLHLGLGLRYVNVAGKTSFAARPESKQAPKMADTKSFDANSYLVVGPEAVFLYGPFSLQGEYMHVTTDAPAVGDPTFGAYTASASWWITGESRKFKTDVAEFDRVKPKRNLFQSGGLGAWELTLRYSNLDLNDSNIVSGVQKGIAGGQMGDITAGVNWQWNPNMRMMFNYVHSDLKNDTKDPSNNIIRVGSNVDSFSVRWQVDF